MRVRYIKVFADEGLREKYERMTGNKTDLRKRYDGLVGNKVRTERGPGRQDVLLTVHRDLEGIRGNLLDMAYKNALVETERLLDAIDNMLSERC